MPLYEYECESCHQRFELIQKYTDPNPDACARCGQGPVRRLLSSPAIQFKGTGWYITDYSNKGKEGGSKSSPALPGSSSEKGGSEKGSSGESGSSSESGTKSDSASKSDSGSASSSGGTTSGSTKASA
ncbi:MAG: FmdB family zinc ribbon protein [Vicinamibacterales bacterium]